MCNNIIMNFAIIPSKQKYNYKLNISNRNLGEWYNFVQE